MKYDFQNSDIKLKLVNGSFGDPSVYTFLNQSGEAILFDLGSIDNLSPREILKINYIFVSHTHMDHFMGFDRLLRVQLPHGINITIVGPEGIAKNIQGKLQGYTWNLIDPDQIKIRVLELEKEKISETIISNTNNFEIVLKGKDPQPSVVNGRGNFQFKYVELDHYIPVISYKITFPEKYRVKNDRILQLGFEPGPWISVLQKKVAEKLWADLVEIAPDDQRTVKELTDKFLENLSPLSIVFVTDIGFTKKNLEALQKTFGSASILICEANYDEPDFQKAIQKMHLTNYQAALIGKMLKVETYIPFHFSNIYISDGKNHEEKSKNKFSQLANLSHQELENRLAKELEKKSD